MWPFIKPIKLIRYLLVWRVNGSLVRLPRCLSTELSLFLGTTIANRLPTRQAGPWRKALAPWDEYGGLSLIGQKKPRTIPEVSWPVEAVLLAYPGKLTYGQGELILWELELMGESADHGFFLEVILPAMEEAGSIADPRWQRQNVLWGRFDVHAIYAARGPRWETVVSDGRLDLSYHATSVQWAEGLTFEPKTRHIFERLTWLTPFDLIRDNRRRHRKKIPPHQVPTLQSILKSLITRMSFLLPGKYNKPDDVWNVLSAEDRTSFQAVMEQAARIPVHYTGLRPAPKHWPGRWIGTQTFPSIPRPIIPYLELASILHIGKQTHFGCGTFTIR
ncbi:MAG: CRISPR system precrRNA processing endoribonuclease RAMP protein Cas6 [Chloroflexota bacterium]|nr:CRISPR system precrRNA processing endoribonuclease RAMP protein Cas6 [Chloroflexota bacterium]